MTKVQVTRQALNDRLDGLRDTMASLRSCKRHERENEKMILARVMKEIMMMELENEDPSINDRRVRLMEQAVEHLGG
jgi:ABC-type uncharacterized transport system ATPase subunit